MMEENYYQDQTVFAEEEPYHLSNRKKKTIEDASLVKKPPKVIFIGAAAFAILFVVLGTALFMKNRTPQQIGPEVTASPTPLLQSASQIDQIMIELRTAVDNADPSKTALPFPPVADQIRIDNQ